MTNIKTQEAQQVLNYKNAGNVLAAAKRGELHIVGKAGKNLLFDLDEVVALKAKHDASKTHQAARLMWKTRSGEVEASIPTKLTRSAAARKAWEARRHQRTLPLETVKPSAAKKAWETRRAHSQKTSMVASIQKTITSKLRDSLALIAVANDRESMLNNVRIMEEHIAQVKEVLGV